MRDNFGENLKEARKNSGMTQAEVAKIVGVAKNTYCNWENGTREPNILKIKALAKAFGVSVDYLVGMEEPNIIHKAQNKYGQKRLLAYIDALNKLTDEDAK